MGAETPKRELPWPDLFPCLRNRAGGAGEGNSSSAGSGCGKPPPQEMSLRALCQRPALPDASSGLVLAGTGNRRCPSSPYPRMDGVGPPPLTQPGPPPAFP